MEENQKEPNDITNYNWNIILSKGVVITLKEVIREAKQTNQKIKRTKEYIMYIETRNRLLEDKNLFNQLKEFRKRNYEIQRSIGGNSFEEINNLVAEYDFLLHNSIVSDFLKAEQRICRLMRELFQSISEGLEFEYLDE